MRRSLKEMLLRKGRAFPHCAAAKPLVFVVAAAIACAPHAGPLRSTLRTPALP